MIVLNKKIFFGIISATDGKLREFGTLINVEEISKRYDDGKLDIKTKAIKVFVVLEIIKELPDKFYGGAIVNYPNNLELINVTLMSKILKDVRHLHKLLNVTKDFKNLMKHFVVMTLHITLVYLLMKNMKCLNCYTKIKD